MKAKQLQGQLAFAEVPRSAPVVQLREGERKRPRKKLGVVDQIRRSFQRGARLATFVGVILGGFVPVGSFVICHGELPGSDGWRRAALLTLIAGGLTFSAKSVFQWSAAAFADKWKALGFVILIEGIMILSETRGLSFAALALLVSINGIASGVILGRDAA